MKTQNQTHTPRHSPGPWEVHGDYTQQLFYVHGANNICDIHRGAASLYGDSRFSRSPAEDEANARLVAAAPDLLAALQTIADAGERGELACADFYSIKSIARAAIAKAKPTTDHNPKRRPHEARGSAASNACFGAL